MPSYLPNISHVLANLRELHALPHMAGSLILLRRFKSNITSATTQSTCRYQKLCRPARRISCRHQYVWFLCHSFFVVLAVRNSQRSIDAQQLVAFCIRLEQRRARVRRTVSACSTYALCVFLALCSLAVQIEQCVER